jgi:hypothetical protein
MKEIIALLLSHWPFFAASAILWFVGQVIKGQLGSQRRLEKSALGRWVRTSLPLHPVVAGALLGLVPGLPVSVAETTVASRCLYFALAGVCSCYCFDVVVRFGERYRKKLELARPGSTKAAP